MKKDIVDGQNAETAQSVPLTGAKVLRRPMKNNSVWARIFKRWDLYLMMVPGLLCLLIFAYGPMYGIIIAFKDYKPYLGIFDSPWTDMNGWANFYYAVASRGFLNLVRNTLILGALKMIFAFPSSIVLALLLNELRLKWFKKVVQTVSYLPYFISWVIISGMLK